MKLDDAQSWAASILRFGRGMFVTPRAQAHPPRPQKRLELYAHESCPFSRKVREVLTELDLAYVHRSCPKGEHVKRAFVRGQGKEMVPFLIDPNTDRRLFDSENIITYLVDTYGEGSRGLGGLVAPLNTFSSKLASASRPRGSRCRPGSEDRVQPEELLELWNFEASPYCRKAREALCELNLDYVVHSVGKRSTRRPQLVALGGKMMVPYLVDPNTGAAMYESDDIVRYLEETYGR